MLVECQKSHEKLTEAEGERRYVNNAVVGGVRERFECEGGF